MFQITQEENIKFLPIPHSTLQQNEEAYPYISHLY